MKQSILLSLLLIALIINFNACSNESNQETTYEKKNKTLFLETEPKSYRKYALVSSGDIKVKKTLSTDGPLADVHANGEVKARSLSLNISGKITASNNLEGSIVRSFDYESPLNKNIIEIRALKVDEYLNVNLLDEYYLLTNDGQAIHKIKDEDEKIIDNDSVEFIFENNNWIIQGDNGNIHHTLVVESNLSIQTNYIFIAGTLLVQGNLISRGELNINTGTPFDKALIVDRNIEVDKLVAIGRVHGSGTFKSQNEVNILGNIEIDGDITLYGDAKINFLDNVYKSALYEAQEEAKENNTTMMLAHSQLFSNAKGKNSVVLFTFVEGNYIINENIINKLIDTNQIDEFKFKSYLYGATIDYASQLQKFDGLSPYFANKQSILKSLTLKGYENIKISESLDIAPSNLYHTFKDKDENILGTYQVYSLSNSFDVNNMIILTQEQRNYAIYQIDNKGEIEASQELEAKEKQEEQKLSIIDNDDLNLTTKSEMLNEIETAENNETTIDKVAVKEEATQDRVQEWVEYKDLASDKVEINVENIIVGEATNVRGWGSRFKRAVKRTFRRVTFSDCKKKTEEKRIRYANALPTEKEEDDWNIKIQLNNSGLSNCTPVSASMILNYHRLRKGKSSLYYSDGHWDVEAEVESKARTEAPLHNIYTKRISDKFNTNDNDIKGTAPWSLYSEVPLEITRELWRNGTYGYSWSYYTAFWNRDWHHNLVRYYINKNNPIMFNSWQSHGNVGGKSTGNHSMPVIGYKREYYQGSCWKKVLAESKWLLVDSTWKSRGYIRFDMTSNYWKFGTMTYIRSW